MASQRYTMSLSSRLLLADGRPSSWLMPKTFSTVLPETRSSSVNDKNRFSGPNSYYCLRSTRTKHHLYCKITSLNLMHIRYKSSAKEPPGGFSENPQTALTEDLKKDMQSFGMPLKSAIITRITPAFETTPSLSDGSKNARKPDDWNDILNRWYTKYQDFIGIADLKRAQDKVTELSEGLLGTQSQRRNLQAEMEDLQDQLTLNHQRITKAELYSEEHQRLFDQARDMNSRLKEVRLEFENCEQLERDTFTQLSAAIRDCHERERTQAEQSKYWSIIASIVSAALASVITSVNNWVRIREIKDHVSSNNQQLIEGYRKMHEDVVEAVSLSKATTVSDVGKREGTLSNAANIVPGEKEVEYVSSVDLSHAGLSEGNLASLSSEVKVLIKEHITDVLANETKHVQNSVTPHLDVIAANLQAIVEGNRKLAELIISGNVGNASDIAGEVNQMKLMSAPLPEKPEMKSEVVDYSYRHIATAMAVGAGIGTLATSFFLGSFSGGAVE